MHQSFKTPNPHPLPSHWGIPMGFTPTVSEKQWKSTPLSSKYQAQFIESNQSMISSDWSHTFFVSCLAPMISVNMQLVCSLLKEVPKQEWNPCQTLALYCEALKKSSGNEVKTSIFPWYPPILKGGGGYEGEGWWESNDWCINVWAVLLYTNNY